VQGLYQAHRIRNLHFLADFRVEKKQTGAGYETQMAHLNSGKASNGFENLLEKCRNYTRHTE
jgi:hypothetical protein